MIKHALLAMTLWLSAAPPSSDPLDGLMPKPIDIELADAPIEDVLMLVGDIAGISVELDPCVSGTATLQLKSVTLRTLLETLANTLDLEYRRDANDGLLVGCREREAKSAAIDLEVVDASVADVVALLAEASGRSLKARGCDDKRIDLAVEHAGIDAVLSMLSTELNATLVREGTDVTLGCGA